MEQDVLRPNENAYQMWFRNNSATLTFQLPDPLNHPQPSLIEFFGEEGTGKTSILLDSIATAAANGYRSLFIDTDGRMRIDKIRSFVRQKLLQMDSNIFNLEEKIEVAMEKIHFAFCTVSSEFEECLIWLQKFNSIAGSEDPVRILCIDTISSFHWEWRCGASNMAQQKRIFELIQVIIRDCSVLCLVARNALHPVNFESYYSGNNEYLLQSWNKLVKHGVFLEKAGSNFMARVITQPYNTQMSPVIFRFSVNNKCIKVL